MRFFQKIIFVFVLSVACFCRADVRLTTSSGQEVYLTETQWETLITELASLNGMLGEVVYGAMGSDVSSLNSNVLELLNQLYFLTTTIPSDVNHGVQDGYLNLSHISNVYSNQLSRFLSAYTNNLAHQFAALPSQNWLNNLYDDFNQTTRNYIEGLFYAQNANYFQSFNEQEPDYWYNTSWERLINLSRNQQFQYVYNSHYNPLWDTPFSGMPYDLQELQRLFVYNLNLLNNGYSFNERDNPIAFSNQLIKVNALKKLLNDKQAAFVNQYNSSLLQANNWENGYVDNQGDFIPWGGWAGDKPPEISALQNFNALSMPINEALEFATNFLSRLSNPNDPVFGPLDNATKDKYKDNIHKQVSMACDWKDQKSLDDFVNGLQDMLNTMSNCCSNMSYVPGIYDLVSNLVENIGDDNQSGSGDGGGSNDVANLDFPLGFAPSETNNVDYFTDWVNHRYNNSIVESTVSDARYAFDRVDSDEHDKKSNQIATNVVNKIVPVASRFKNYIRPLVSQAPSTEIKIIDVEPIRKFAVEQAKLNPDLDYRSGYMDISNDTWTYTKLISPLHGFFLLFWVAMTAFLLIMSYLWLFKRFMSFRMFLIRLWGLFVKVLFCK